MVAKHNKRKSSGSFDSIVNYETPSFILNPIRTCLSQALTCLPKTELYNDSRYVKVEITSLDCMEGVAVCYTVIDHRNNHNSVVSLAVILDPRPKQFMKSCNVDSIQFNSKNIYNKNKLEYCISNPFITKTNNNNNMIITYDQSMNQNDSDSDESDCNVDMLTIDAPEYDSQGRPGRWTTAEHQLFLQSFKKYGKNWKKLSSIITTRSVLQIRTHTQKYLQKLQRAQNNPNKKLSKEQKLLLAKHVSISLLIKCDRF